VRRSYDCGTVPSQLDMPVVGNAIAIRKQLLGDSKLTLARPMVAMFSVTRLNAASNISGATRAIDAVARFISRMFTKSSYYFRHPTRNAIPSTISVSPSKFRTISALASGIPLRVSDDISSA